MFCIHFPEDFPTETWPLAHLDKTCNVVGNVVYTQQDFPLKHGHWLTLTRRVM